MPKELHEVLNLYSFRTHGIISLCEFWNHSIKKFTQPYHFSHGPLIHSLICFFKNTCVFKIKVAFSSCSRLDRVHLRRYTEYSEIEILRYASWSLDLLSLFKILICGRVAISLLESLHKSFPVLNTGSGSVVQSLQIVDSAQFW